MGRILDPVPAAGGGDLDLACYALQSRQRQQAEQVLHETHKLWMASNTDLPENCTPLLDAAIASNIIGEADIWLHLRLALEAGNLTLAKRLSAKLPAARVLSSSELDRAAMDPIAYLSRDQSEYPPL